jgi:hypothetical protein
MREKSKLDDDGFRTVSASTFLGNTKQSRPTFLGESQVAEGSKSMPQFPVGNKAKTTGVHRSSGTASSRKRGRQPGAKSLSKAEKPRRAVVRPAWQAESSKGDSDVLSFYDFGELDQVDGPKSSRGKKSRNAGGKTRPSTVSNVSYARYDMLPILTSTGETPFELGLNSGAQHVLPVFQLPQVSTESKIVRTIEDSITNQVRCTQTHGIRALAHHSNHTIAFHFTG